MKNINHPAKRLLQHYRKHGAPVKFSTKPWSRKQLHHSLKRGAHKSCFEYLEFLEEEFIDMISKDQWVILPYSVVKDLPGLRLSPPGVVPQRERCPRWICDYSFYAVNLDTLPLAALESMQFGHALDRILRHILLANPELGPVYLMKVDLSDVFYRVDLSPDDAPKLGVVFPTLPNEEPLVAIPLVLPMGWKNSPPIFSTVTETIADVANSVIEYSHDQIPSHPLGNLAQIQDDNALAPSAPQHSSQPTSSSSFSLDDNALAPSAPQHSSQPTSSSSPSLSPSSHKKKTYSSMLNLLRDPHLPYSKELLGYIDIFVDDFIGLAQGRNHRNRVRNILMNAIDEVFRPLSPNDKPSRREPVSIKKLLKGDCSWSTVKLVLGWIINTVDQTISLPEHRVQRLAEILASIPRTQKRISIRKWHKVLGELRSMSLALPGARHLFSHMQHALLQRKGGRLSLKKGVHAAIADFKWILRDIESRPTRIAELVPLLASAVGHHDASGEGAGGGWFPSDHLPIRNGHTRGPFVWRVKWPEHIAQQLITDKNPLGTISISDLELAGGLLHLDALAQAYDIRERTVLSKTDNLATLFWQRKGSTTTDKVPAYLLRLFGIHQRYHRYVARHDYLPENLFQSASPEARDRFSCDLRTAEETVKAGISTGRAKSTNMAWIQWTNFCSEMAIDPFLETVENPIPILQVFALRVREGVLAAGGAPVRARTAEDYLRFVGQTFQGVGSPDPRLNTFGKIDFRLSRMISAWKKQDPPPNRVKPVPIRVIRSISFIAQAATDHLVIGISDMITIAFFYLLRPGEYTATASDTQPFDFKSVQLFIGEQRLDLRTAPAAQIQAATFASLTFEKQKNGVEGEVIGLARSGDAYLCPVKALARRILHLRQHNASNDTPLATIYTNNKQTKITPSMITTTLRHHVALIGPSLGFLPTDVSVRCLRAAGANALLTADIDPCIIQLLRRWRSDEMLRYLHVQSKALMKDYSARMLQSGDFTLIPNQVVPMF